METESHREFAEIFSRYQSGSISRRHAMRMLGALGLAGFAGNEDRAHSPFSLSAPARPCRGVRRHILVRESAATMLSCGDTSG